MALCEGPLNLEPGHLAVRHEIRFEGCVQFRHASDLQYGSILTKHTPCAFSSHPVEVGELW